MLLFVYHLMNMECFCIVTIYVIVLYLLFFFIGFMFLPTSILKVIFHDLFVM